MEQENKEKSALEKYIERKKKAEKRAEREKKELEKIYGGEEDEE